LKNVDIFITKSDIENPKLGFESPDPEELSETPSFLGENVTTSSIFHFWADFMLFFLTENIGKNHIFDFSSKFSPKMIGSQEVLLGQGFQPPTSDFQYRTW